MTPLLVLLLASAAPPANCAAAVTQLDMNQCEGARAGRADGALNAAWKRFYAQAGGAKAASLAAQRIWLQWRTAECAARGKAYEGGSMRPMVVSGCYADLTEARAKQLASLVQDR